MALFVPRRILVRKACERADSLPEFKGKLTTTEFMAKYLHDAVKDKLSDRFNGKISVTLGESHVAWASYDED